MHGTRIRWLQILVVLIVLTLHNNHMGKIAAQELETVLPSFYISDEATIWLVDFEERRQIEMFTLSDQRQVSVDSLPTSEHFMLAGFDKPVTHVSRYIRGLTSVNKNRLLIQVDNERCNHMVTGNRACAGYSELLLLNPDKSVRHLTTIEYHYAPALDSMTCWRGNDVQLGQIVVNPSKDQAVIRLGKLHFQCDRSNTWGIILDFSENEVIREDIPFGYGFSWSPDGKTLAYVDLAECIVLQTQQELFDCGGTLKLRTETETVSLPPLTVNPGDIAHHFDHPIWVDANTLAYSQYTTPPLAVDSLSTEFVWRNTETNENTVETYEWPLIEELYYLDAISPVLLGHRQAYNLPFEITIIDAFPPFRVIHHLPGYKIRGCNNQSRQVICLSYEDNVHSTLPAAYFSSAGSLDDVVQISLEFISDADSILYAAPVID